VINAAGIKKHGLLGRFKNFFKPQPLVGPIMILTNLVIPVSLSIRLFGNMLGGMIVIELVYMVASVIVPGVLNSFFVVFHVLLQTYVFITLLFTYVGEAVE